MFSIILRTAVTLVVAAPVIWVWRQVMDPAIAYVDYLVVDGEESVILGYVETAVFWFPFVALTMLLIYVIVGALETRGHAGGIR